jgi:hypothetical protein
MHRAFYSQFGEDRILSIVFAAVPRGVCVEVGANDGVNDSNSYHFEKIGWNCILVEPNPRLCVEIRSSRTATLIECAASEHEGRAVLNVAEGRSRSHGVSSLSIVPGSKARIESCGVDVKPTNLETRRHD